MLRIFKLMNIRNRAYVVDNRGNKLFYGTEFQCKKFIDYMKDGEINDRTDIYAVGFENHSKPESVVSFN